MVKSPKILKNQRGHSSESKAEGNPQNDNISDLEIEKILKFCADSGIPLHTIHGDVTYHFVTTNIYICSEHSAKASCKDGKEAK